MFLTCTDLAGSVKPARDPIHSHDLIVGSREDCAEYVDQYEYCDTDTNMSRLITYHEH